MIVLDGSGSIEKDDGDLIDKWELSKAFAKDTVEAFAEENIFENGGTVSFTQFSDVIPETGGGTFFSKEAVDDALTSETLDGGGTDLTLGIMTGSGLLAQAPPASASFMVFLTDGQDGGDPTVRAGTVRCGMVWHDVIIKRATM